MHNITSTHFIHRFHSSSFNRLINSIPFHSPFSRLVESIICNLLFNCEITCQSMINVVRDESFLIIDSIILPHSHISHFVESNVMTISNLIGELDISWFNKPSQTIDSENWKKDIGLNTTLKNVSFTIVKPDRFWIDS
jgi:hypothetical protein